MIKINFILSMIKSLFRISGCALLFTGNYIGAACMFCIAELFNIWAKIFNIISRMYGA